LAANIFFADVMAENDDFFDKTLEGFTMFALNQGEVCTCPSRALVQRSRVNARPPFPWQSARS
jgi:aldehyde dehydrogenase